MGHSDPLRSRSSSQAFGASHAASYQDVGVPPSASGQLMHAMSANSSHKDIVSLENEVDILKFELESTKAKMESEVNKARQEAMGIMKATGVVTHHLH